MIVLIEYSLEANKYRFSYPFAILLRSVNYFRLFVSSFSEKSCFFDRDGV